MAEALRRALDAISHDEPVDWLVLHTEAADAGEAEQLADLQALEQMSQLAAPRGVSGLALVAPEAPGRTSLDVAEKWGSIEIRGHLGRGAYGDVYEGWDTRLAREVALKLLPSESSGATVEEARRLARVRHPHVVTVFGADQHDGVPGLWMELLHGRTLDDILWAQGQFSAGEAATIVGDVCSAVASLHAAGLVHRDIKAQNVMREVGGRIVLMDLGTSMDLGRSDAPVASLAGTPLYMAPELFDGAPPTVASDVYALGVLLYRLVSNTFPMEAQTIADVRAAHAETRLRPLREVRADLPTGFVAVVERAMAAHAKDRFRSASDLERALRAPDGPRLLSGAWRQAAWISAALVLVALLGVLAAGVGWRAGRVDADDGRSRVSALPDDQFRLFGGYVDLAFEKRATSPQVAYDEVLSAYRLIRPVLPGDEAIHGVLSMYGAWLRLAAGDTSQARKELDDARYQLHQSVGEHHPYASVAALMAARLTQGEGRHEEAAAEVVRALRIRWNVLGLDRLASKAPTEMDLARLAKLSASYPVERDTDGDGILDVLEAAVGLDPERADSDGDGVPDQDEDADGDGVSNLLALGVGADPFLTVAQVGPLHPFGAMWQKRHNSRQAPDAGPPGGWSVSTTSQGGVAQLLPNGVRARAFERGFSLFLRATPRAGLAYSTIDTFPSGPRFDLVLKRTSEASIESVLWTDVVSQHGLTNVHPWSVHAPPLFELRHRPGEGARLYRDGQVVRADYDGHRQFLGGGVAFGAMVPAGDQPDANAVFHLVWLEVR
jgi:hypothetical protein